MRKAAYLMDLPESLTYAGALADAENLSAVLPEIPESACWAEQALYVNTQPAIPVPISCQFPSQYIYSQWSPL